MRKPKNYKQLKGECDSIFEKTLREGVLSGTIYHPTPIKYTEPEKKHVYRPDFLYVPFEPETSLSRFKYYIEVKGRFRDVRESQKYVHISDSLNDFERLVFLFMSPHVAMPGAKKRKNGSVMTHAEWAEKNGFKWFTRDTIKELIGENTRTTN